MRTHLLVVLTVLAVSSAAFSGERKDPFDEYIYHAPQLSGIVCDGDPSDWPQWLPWEPIDHMWECDRNCCWLTDWNCPPSGPNDFAARFKAAWGMVEDWPLLYLLVEWMDDEFHFDPEGSWNTTDMLMFAYGETLYDYDGALSENDGWRVGFGHDLDYATRCMQVRAAEGWGIRVASGLDLVVDESQPLAKARWQRASASEMYLECQVQMFQNYVERTPWQVAPGNTCLAFSFIQVADYDPRDGSFTYLTWGRFEPCWHYDIRVAFSTIAFEPGEYYAAVSHTTWGSIKRTF
jgi:hypothetical protein